MLPMPASMVPSDEPYSRSSRSAKRAARWRKQAEALRSQLAQAEIHQREPALAQTDTTARLQVSSPT
jgi:hypothetical protein